MATLCVGDFLNASLVPPITLSETEEGLRALHQVLAPLCAAKLHRNFL